MLIGHHELWQGLPAIVSADTIWHLPSWARVALVLFSSFASVAIGLFCLVKAQCVQRYFQQRLGRKLWVCTAATLVDLSLTLLVMWSALGLAPQLFYTLYVAVIPELPVQWVVSFVDWRSFITMINLSVASTLAAMATGLLIWVIAVATMLFWIITVLGKSRVKSR